MQRTTLFRLRQLNLALEQTSRPCLAELGLTSAQAVVLLWFLRRGGSGACASELHRQLGVSKAALSATLKNLRRSGYLDTVRDPGDDRKKRMAPTARARAVQPKIEQGLALQHRRLCDGIPPGQLAAFDRCLDRMLQNLGRSPEPTTGRELP